MTVPAGDGVRCGPRTNPVEIFVTDGVACVALIVPRGPAVIFAVTPKILPFFQNTKRVNKKSIVLR